MWIRCDQTEVTAVDSVLLPPTSFELSAPGLVALTGTNGSGKTTLLKTLAGRQLPTEGQCLINGGAPYEQDPQFRAAVASLIDTPPVARDLMLIEQLAIVATSWGAERDAAFAQADELLSRLTIDDLGERFPYELSAGQLQLFAIALTLIRPCQLLLLDEPERHLDGDRVEALLTLFEERVQKGTLVITATHRPEIMERTSQRIHLEPRS